MSTHIDLDLCLQPAAHLGTVYFIENATHAVVKIGFTAKSVNDRLRALQTGCHVPLATIAELPGTIADEAMLHALFAPLRLHGEWFRREHKLDDFLSYLEYGATYEAAMWDCVATGMTFPFRDLQALGRSANLRFLPAWCAEVLHDS